jgi:uncharacterized protein (TIGR02646 family)
MRYIDKSNRCEAFDNFVTTYRGRLRNDWKLFKRTANGSSVRLILHQHLWRVQKGLCSYCEQEVPKKTKPEEELKSHFEHIRGQKKFPQLVFNFENIIISCEGFDLISNILDNKRQFCGAKKDQVVGGVHPYDDTLFLNPTELPDIESYFRFDSEGNIEPHPSKTLEEQNRAAYMIRILILNHPVLINMRQKQYSFWYERKTEISYEQLTADLDENLPFLPSFFSMLKQRFL